MTPLLASLAAAESPASPQDPAQMAYQHASACWRDEDCRVRLGQACDAGDDIACAAFGRATMAEHPGTDLPEAKAAFERACARVPALCTEAVSAWRHDTAEDAAARRRLLSVGCDGDDVGACLDLSAEWQRPPGADQERALAAGRHACALNEWTCRELAVTLLHGSQASQWAEGRAILVERVAAGDDDAARDVVAIRFGGPDNLPLPVRAAWDRCLTARPRDCNPLADLLRELP